MCTASHVNQAVEAGSRFPAWAENAPRPNGPGFFRFKTLLEDNFEIWSEQPVSMADPGRIRRRCSTGY